MNSSFMYFAIYFIVYYLADYFLGENKNILLLIISIISLLYGIIMGIISSKKSFVCFSCGHNFKLKWHKLALVSWKIPRRFRSDKELDSVIYERVYVKCPDCKSWDCGASKEK